MKTAHTQAPHAGDTRLHAARESRTATPPLIGVGGMRGRLFPGGYTAPLLSASLPQPADGGLFCRLRAVSVRSSVLPCVPASPARTPVPHLLSATGDLPCRFFVCTSSCPAASVHNTPSAATIGRAAARAPRTSRAGEGVRAMHCALHAARCTMWSARCGLHARLCAYLLHVPLRPSLRTFPPSIFFFILLFFCCVDLLTGRVISFIYSDLLRSPGLPHPPWRQCAVLVRACHSLSCVVPCAFLLPAETLLYICVFTGNEGFHYMP